MRRKREEKRFKVHLKIERGVFFLILLLTLLHSDEMKGKRQDPTFLLNKEYLHFRIEQDALPVGWLLVGVDAGMPLHCLVLFAGLCSFYCSSTWSCCHGGSCCQHQVKLCHARRKPSAHRAAVS